jgi:hypothetical protein
MRNRGPKLSAAVALMALCLNLPACGQTQATSSAQALPSDAELDALWNARKWDDLAAALANPDSPQSVARGMNWLHSRLDEGGGLLLGMFYARDLWLVGTSQNIADPDRDLRVTAGMITLYTV